EGVVKNSNTTCLNGRPFREDVSCALSRPIAFENDANCFALAEARLGAAAPYQDGVVFGVIMGTGVGGGLVIGGKLWPGLQDIAGEWGHHAVFHDRPRRCYCGKTGCLEMYLAGPWIEAAYRDKAGADRKLHEIAAHRSTDDAAREVMDEMLLAFGRGLAN